MNLLRATLPAALCMVLGSCASAPPPFPPVKPGESFQGSYINVRAPNSEGWRLVSSSRNGMSFAKYGMAPGENFGAQLLMFELKPTDTRDEFVELIKKGAQEDTDPKRFEPRAAFLRYTNEREYPCVRYDAMFYDKAARTSATTKEGLLLETYSLYCRHPVRTDTGFAIIFSYRGGSRYPDLAKEAEEFIKGIQVPSAQF